MARTKRYPGTLEKRTSGYRLIYYIGGTRKTRVLGTHDRKTAESLAEDWYAAETKIAEREATGLPGRVRFSELVDLFRRLEKPALAPGAQDAYEDSFKPLEEFFRNRLRDPHVHAIQPGHVSRFLAWRREHRTGGGQATLAPRTLAKDFAVLRRLMGFAVEQAVLDRNPLAGMRGPKWDKFEPIILEQEQYEALLAACADRPMLRLYVLVLGETGLRAYSEALRLTWEDIDLADGFIRVRGRRAKRQDGRTKTGRGRWVPMTPILREAMQEHFARYRFASYDGQRPEYVFHHPTTRRHYKAGEQIKDMRRAFDSAARRAGIPAGFRRHDLRHRRVTSWLAEGKTPVLVQAAMGHASFKTTEDYLHLIKDHLRELVDQPVPATDSGEGWGEGRRVNQ